MITVETLSATLKRCSPLLKQRAPTGPGEGALQRSGKTSSTLEQRLSKEASWLQPVASRLFVIEFELDEFREMCRNIRILFNFDPPVTEEEIRAAALQYVRKISGCNKPSKANEAIFVAAVDEVAMASARLLASLETSAIPRNREEEAAKAKARSAERFPAREASAKLGD